HLAQAVALIEVDAAAHRGDWHALQPTEAQLARVALDGRNREVRDLGEWNDDRCVDLVGQVAQPGAEDQSDTRREAATRLNRPRGLGGQRGDGWARLRHQPMV